MTTKRELAQLRAVIAQHSAAYGVDPAVLLAKIERLAAMFEAMTPAEREAWDRNHPIPPSGAALAERIARIAARRRPSTNPESATRIDPSELDDYSPTRGDHHGD